MIEAEFLSKLLTSPESDQSSILRVMLPEKMFKTHTEEYAFITDFYRKHDKAPSLKTFKDQFPDFKLAKDLQEPLPHYADAIVRRENYNVLTRGVARVNKLLTDHDYTGVSKAIVEMNRIQDKLLLPSSSLDVDFDKAVDHSIALYRSFGNAESRRRMKPPYPSMVTHRMIPGFEPQNLVTMFGRWGVGKTWAFFMFVLSSVMQGYDTLLVSCEMSADEVLMRINAMLFELNYTDLMFGALDPVEEARFIEERKNIILPGKLIISDASEIFGTEGQSPLGVIRNKAKVLGCDALFIDSAHVLFGLTDGVTMVEDAYKTSRTLKREVAKASNLITFITVQAGRSGETKGKIVKSGGTGVQWADAFGQDSDYLLELYGQRGDNTKTLEVLKARHGCEGAITIHFEMNPVNLTEIGVNKKKETVSVTVDVDDDDDTGVLK